MDIPTHFVDLIGLIATSFSICMWLPQARITWQNRNDPVRLAGVSETTQWLSMMGYLLWGIFGFLIGSFWVAAPSLVSFPLSIATIVVIRRGRTLPVTRTVPIISMAEPLAVITSTAPVPVISTENLSGNHTPTTPIPVLA